MKARHRLSMTRRVPGPPFFWVKFVAVERETRWPTRPGGRVFPWDKVVGEAEKQASLQPKAPFWMVHLPDGTFCFGLSHPSKRKSMH